MRFFVALEIPSENLLQFKTIQDSLHTLIPQARLTDLDKIHLTLAFVGEQPEVVKNRLIAIIKQAAQGVPAFEVTPAYLDGFPNIHHPLVLWVGVKGDIDKILLIRERVKDGLEGLHLPADERRFIPHITIAKFNNHFRIDRNLEVSLEKMMAASFDPIKITSIKLFESEPQNGLHKHNTLAEVKLS
ncbi:RNA 2',3'-cyclic phosphodiesterase [Candidatus Daviesbacteria bacterium]|nr:RNA 2',3'-cyclic phosphodiesterase [Candidatus Daviesbacteria bacterium]